MPAPATTTTDAPPSRHGNPFATCWTRPGALPFRFNNGQSAKQLVATLTAQHWRGAIVGPHGSGKSTLLEALKPVIAATGRNVLTISLHDGQRRLPGRFLAKCASNANSLVIVDGYEQLAWSARLGLWLRCHTRGGGLLVTSHEPIRLPTLIQLSPDCRLVEQLVDDLGSEVSTTINRADIAASHACHGSNIREIFFELYDRHEERRRQSNTLPTTS